MKTIDRLLEGIQDKEKISKHDQLLLKLLDEQGKIKDGMKQPPMPASNLFYDEELLIQDAYRSLKTPEGILEAQRQARAGKAEPYYRQRAQGFMMDSFRYAGEEGRPGKDLAPFQWQELRFEQLGKEQLQTYFRFRNKVLKGQEGSATAFHIILFAMELVSFSFNPRADFNLSVLEHLARTFASSETISETLNGLVQGLRFELGLGMPRFPRGEKPLLYQELEAYEKVRSAPEGAKFLSKISINTWKPYFHRGRRSKFLKGNRPKVYRVFKECLILLEEELRLQGTDWQEAYFQVLVEEETRVIYGTLPIYRVFDGNVKTKVLMEACRPTERLYEDLYNFFRMSENVARIMTGETRTLKIEKVFSPNLQQRMLELMTAPKVKRSKPKPQEPEIIPEPVIVDFNDERIRQLQRETEGLVAEVDQRASLYESHQEAHIAAFQAPLAQPPAPELSGLDRLESFMEAGPGLDEVDIQDFAKVLQPKEVDFLIHFQGLALDLALGTKLAKKSGSMLGSLLAAINEKALDILGDNLIEEEDGRLVIYEEFGSVVEELKKE